MKKKLLLLLSLFVISIATLSNVTYALFTEQYNPEIKNFSFNLATHDYLMISTSGNAGTFKDYIDFNDMLPKDINGDPVQVELNPLYGTIKDDNSINVGDSDDYLASLNQNYVKLSLYFSSNRKMNVYLAGDNDGKVVKIDKDSMDPILFTDAQINKIIESLRIGFVSNTTHTRETSSGRVRYYEPLDSNIYSVNEKTSASYNLEAGEDIPYETFTKTTKADNDVTSDSVVLFQAEANEVYKLDVYVWIEGKDVNCIEDIFNSYLKISLRFFGEVIEEADN